MEHEFNNLRVVEQGITAALQAGDVDAEAKCRQAGRDALLRIQARLDSITVITPENILG